jgi:biotin carboxylase
VKDAVAIIDPISSGRRYGREAQAMGFRAIAVLTPTSLPDALKRFASVESFDEVHDMSSIEETAHYLLSRQVKAVIAGHHFALRTVDVLADKLGLIGNPLGSVDARRNKLAMKRKLLEKGVAATQSRAISTHTIADFEDFSMKFPVVVKPSEGSGSLQVKVCRNLEDLASGLQAIESLDRVYAGEDRMSLVEEYIDGPEYFMTTANYGDGAKQLLCFAKYDKVQKENRPSIYKNIYSLSIDSDEARAAFRYISDINRALDVDVGVNDIEFKITPTGPLVIEQNNRLPGADVPFLIEKCTGINCYQLNISIFSGVATDRPEASYKKHFYICCLINDIEGTVEDIQGTQAVKALPGVIGIDLLTEVGAVAYKTVDFITTWAFVYMVHESPAQLERNAEYIHDNMRLRVAGTSSRYAQS